MAHSKTAKRPTRRPLAVRLDEDDWAFLESQNAQNPSEGLRAILTHARQASIAPATVADAQARLNHLIAAAVEGFRTPPRSVVSEDILREASLILATAMVGPPQPGFSDPAARMAFEAKLVDLAVDLAEALLRHSLAPEAAAWNPGVIRQRLLACRTLLTSSLSSIARDNPPSASASEKTR